jgi:hypothetical protein
VGHGLGRVAALFGHSQPNTPPGDQAGDDAVEHVHRRARWREAGSWPLKTLEEAQGPLMPKWIEQAGRVRGWQ